MNQLKKYTGFTLVEILIVVIILGILAAIVLPQFSSATARSRASMMADDLRIFRTQITIFKSQHRDVPPGYPGLVVGSTPTEAALISQLTLATNSAGGTAAPGTAGYPFGPYLREIPVNPLNSKNSVRVVAAGDSVAPADTDGWIYQPANMLFKADSTGADDNGVAFSDY
jgi:prepilin-type N-terminal cleavage/methylation domain-containing protein